MDERIKEFLADDEVPADIRALVKARIFPEPKYKPGPDEISRDKAAAEAKAKAAAGG